MADNNLSASSSAETVELENNFFQNIRNLVTFWSAPVSYGSIPPACRLPLIYFLIQDSISISFIIMSYLIRILLMEILQKQSQLHFYQLDFFFCGERETGYKATCAQQV